MRILPVNSCKCDYKKSGIHRIPLKFDYPSIIFFYSSTVSSAASAAGAASGSRTFILRLIFLSSPLKSTTLASIS